MDNFLYLTNKKEALPLLLAKCGCEYQISYSVQDLMFTLSNHDDRNNLHIGITPSFPSCSLAPAQLVQILFSSGLLFLLYFVSSTSSLLTSLLLLLSLFYFPCSPCLPCPPSGGFPTLHVGGFPVVPVVPVVPVSPVFPVSSTLESSLSSILEVSLSSLYSLPPFYRRVPCIHSLGSKKRPRPSDEEHTPVLTHPRGTFSPTCYKPEGLHSATNLCLNF